MLVAKWVTNQSRGPQALAPRIVSGRAESRATRRSGRKAVSQLGGTIQSDATCKDRFRNAGGEKDRNTSHAVPERNSGDIGRFSTQQPANSRWGRNYSSGPFSHFPS